MTDRQRAFLAAYFADDWRNATKAAAAAGYKDAPPVQGIGAGSIQGRTWKRHRFLPFRRADSPSIAPPMRRSVIVAGSGTGETQLVMLLLSRVTAPFRARALPSRMVDPVFRVMLVFARMCPSNAVAVPTVAELPT